mgnify:CR=1 FL=1
MSICGLITLIMAGILIVAGFLYIIGKEKYGDRVLYLIRIVIVSVLLLIIGYLILYLLGLTTLDSIRDLLTTVYFL